MFGISNPILLQIGESEGTSYQSISSYVQTLNTVPGYGNIPIYFGSLVVGYANFYALNLPQNEGSTSNQDVLKGYFVIIYVFDVPSGSSGINVSPINTPPPFFVYDIFMFTLTGEIDIDVIPQDISANSSANVIQFYMPSSAPATECALLVGF